MIITNPSMRLCSYLGLSCLVGLAACGSGSDASAPPGSAGSPPAQAGAAGMPSAQGGSAGASAAGAPVVVAGSGGDLAGAAQGGGTSSAGNAGSDATIGGASSGAGGVGATGGAAGGAASGAPGTSGGAGPITCNGAALCDGFERTMLGTDWTLENAVAANTVELVSDKAHSGTSSVHMKFGTASGATFISESKGFPAPNGYWGRVWLYMMTGLETGHHVYLEASFGGDPTNTGIRALNTQSGGFLATNNAPPDKGGTSPTQKMPQGKWTCFEWHVVGTGGKENVNLYMDGTEVPGTAASTTPAETLTKQRIGYERYNPGTAGEMWIDDYAIGTTRIDCN